MELFLAHHEIVLLFLLSLLTGGFICFRYLFPLLGRMIVDWTNKYSHKQDQEEKRFIPYFESEIDRLRRREYFETESQIAEVLSKTIESMDAVKQRMIDIGFKKRLRDCADLDAAERLEDQIDLELAKEALERGDFVPLDSIVELKESEYKKNYIPREDWEQEQEPK